MCQAEEELKSVNSPVQDNKKEKEVNTEKVVSKVKETEHVTDSTNEQELDLDQDIPF